jgi:hypothetical protein
MLEQLYPDLADFKHQFRKALASVIGWLANYARSGS